MTTTPREWAALAGQSLATALGDITLGLSRKDDDDFAKHIVAALAAIRLADQQLVGALAQMEAEKE